MGTWGYIVAMITEGIQASREHPAGTLFCILMMAVILVNGWTDAPNAIVTCVSSGAMSMGGAIFLAAIFNFLGVIVMSLLHASVVATVYGMVDLSGEPLLALAALNAALFSVVVWALLAWWAGIPTSESHGLLAGLSGAAFAFGGFAQINGQVWIKILLGMGLSMIFGYGISRLAVLLIRRFQKRAPHVRAVRKAQIVCAGIMAFLHGAQDGQKFIGVMLLGISLAGLSAFGLKETSSLSTQPVVIPLWATLACAGLMAMGTAIGGRRIIRKVGMEMVRLDPWQGLAADLGAGICLLFLTLFGIPTSTTQAKISAVMGAGASGPAASCPPGVTGINQKMAMQTIYTWFLTFPFCGLVGYLLTRLLSNIFYVGG